MQSSLGIANPKDEASVSISLAHSSLEILLVTLYDINGHNPLQISNIKSPRISPPLLIKCFFNLDLSNSDHLPVNLLILFHYCFHRVVSVLKSSEKAYCTFFSESGTVVMHGLTFLMLTLCFTRIELSQIAPPHRYP